MLESLMDNWYAIKTSQVHQQILPLLTKLLSRCVNGSYCYYKLSSDIDKRSNTRYIFKSTTQCMAE